MASVISVIVKALNIKNMHIDNVEYVEGEGIMNGENYRRDSIHVTCRPYKRIRQQCPICRKKCSIYDHQAKEEVSWRANSLNGVPIYLLYKPVRVECKEHGVLTEYIPWVDGKSRFTAGFNNEVAYMALTCPKTVVSQYMGINWRTVGNCIKAAHERLEPDLTARLRGLRRICVDETSYRRGHEYVTVVYDLDRNRVVWVHKDHGYEVFKQFCELLSEEERDALEVIAGDGARWIDRCRDEYFKNARRCMDFFHAVSWVNEALDKVRNSARAQADREVEQMKKEFKAAEEKEKEEKSKIQEELKKARQELDSMPKTGRPSMRKKELRAYMKQLKERLESYGKQPETAVTEEEYKAAKEELATMPVRGRRSARKAQLLTIITLYERTSGNDKEASLSAAHKKIIDELVKKAADIKGTKYALGMNPENLNESLKDKLALVQESFPGVYLAYQLKEQLRVILHMKDVFTASAALDEWISTTSECGIKPFEELSKKVERHRENLLNAVELRVNSSRSEATNTTIKSLIATARGFRNLGNMFALIYLRCSDIVVPLHNRYQPSPAKQKELRDLQNMRKKQRKEEKIRNALR